MKSFCPAKIPNPDSVERTEHKWSLRNKTCCLEFEMAFHPVDFNSKSCFEFLNERLNSLLFRKSVLFEIRRDSRQLSRQRAQLIEIAIDLLTKDKCPFFRSSKGVYRQMVTCTDDLIFDDESERLLSSDKQLSVILDGSRCFGGDNNCSLICCSTVVTVPLSRK